MNKDELIKTLKDYLQSEEIMTQFNLTLAPLLKAEKENLYEEETNWQSLVLSTLMKLPIISGGISLFYDWQVKGLETVEEVRDYFCTDKNWVLNENWCMSDEGRCWEKKRTKVDAVLKDKNGNWLAIFEYEDDYDSCCQELCSMLKVMRWLKNQQSKPPILCLFYWLPLKPKKKSQESKENLEWYIDFINKYMYGEFRGTRFVIVLQGGPNEPPYAITKTRVISDDDFDDLEDVINQEFETLTK